MIKRASSVDLPVLLGISQRSFSTPWSATSFEAEFAKPFSITYLYVKGEQPIAYLTIWVIDDEGEIVSIAVDKGWRGKGVASALLNYVFSECRLKVWQLEVSETNKSALSLYHKFGFRKSRIIKNYYGQGRDAIQMRKEIG